MVQADAVRLTTIAALLEWQRDWARREHYNVDGFPLPAKANSLVEQNALPLEDAPGLGAFLDHRRKSVD
jgi:hypothetical protein